MASEELNLYHVQFKNSSESMPQVCIVQQVTLLQKSGLGCSSILSTVCISLGRAINATTKNG
jgi:hypothetical protein